jgi:predicted nuclease of restriction endonuclease-like RecB superfamily
MPGILSWAMRMILIVQFYDMRPGPDIAVKHPDIAVKHPDIAVKQEKPGLEPVTLWTSCFATKNHSECKIIHKNTISIKLKKKKKEKKKRKKRCSVVFVV